jgi:UDP-glucose:(heptosyl)LPS alpha-1,3-glucosyltransferase
MRIALVILHADAARGGAERYTIDLAAALAREGHEVSLLAASFANVPERVAPVKLDDRGVTRGGRYERFLDSLDQHLDRAAYDVVHAMLPVRRCDAYHPHAGIAVAALDRWTTTFNPRRKRMAEVERDLLSGPESPVVLCLSEYVKRSVCAHYALPEDRLATLFNAVDLDRFAPQREQTAPAQTARALIVAQDFERKGVIQAMEAARVFPSGRLRLIVVGREPSNRYRRYALELGIDVNFAGATDDTRPFYREADFFVLPTNHDPCSLVVLEALAMGLPVISTRFNGACEIMTEGVHGYVLDDPGDVAALADAMRKMLDSELRARMSRACLQLRARLSYEHHLRNLLGIYRRARSMPPADQSRAAPTR